MDTSTQMAGLPILRARTRGQRLKRDERKELKRAFLALYARTGSARATCKQIGIARATLYAWLQKDSRFKAAYDKEERRLYPPQPEIDLEQFMRLHRIGPRYWSNRRLMRRLTAMYKRTGRF